MKIGYFARPRPDVQIGVAYSPAIKMSKLSSYAGLFAENGRFNIPASASAGLAYKIAEPVTLTADYQRIHYSDIASVGNALLPNLMTAPLGADKGAGFGWHDINVYKLGTQWKANDVWTWRAGYSKTKSPIQASEVLFNILAPGVVEDHFTFGFTKDHFNLALMYAPPRSVRGANPLEAPNAQQIELKMHEIEIEFGYSFGF